MSDAGLTASRARGLVPGPPRAYLADSMHYFSRFNPFRAFKDLRRFLARRQRYEIYMLFASAAVTWVVMWVFLTDDRSIEIPYERNIVYVQNWKADRSIEETRAQLKVDKVQKDAAIAAWEAKQKKRQAEFKKVDDFLTSWGF
jgi:hypothetical protein